MKSQTQNIMSTDLITIAQMAPLIEAFELMKQERIRHLPVVDAHDNVIGIISDRDLHRAMVRTSKKIEISAEEGDDWILEDQSFQFNNDEVVSDYMSHPVRCVSVSTSVRDASLMMMNEKISAYLVVDSKHQPRGIVTTDDMLRLLVSMLDKDPGKLKLSIDEFVSDPVYGQLIV